MFLTFISAVASDTETSVLTAVQLLWVNLIMDTFAALALATDPPTLSILDRDPEPKSAPLITLTMWKMIIGQSIFQLIVTLVLYFRGASFLSYQTQRERDQLQSLIFNTFVWMQIFNQVNSRRIDNKLNIFEGVLQNYFFIGIQFIIVAGQVMIIFVGGEAFSTHRLNGAQWGYSIVLGLLSVPVAVMIRLVPDDALRKFIPPKFAKSATPKLFVSDEERQYEWNPALEEIREELTFLKKLRGGRLNVLRYKLQHPVETLLPRSRAGSSRSRSRANSLPQTPTGEQTGSEIGSNQAPATPDSRKSGLRRSSRPRSNSAIAASAVIPGIVAGSVAGWSPIGRRSEDGGSMRPSQLESKSQVADREGAKAHPPASSREDVSNEDRQSKAHQSS